MSNTTRRTSLLCFLACFPLLAACGGDDPAPASPPASLIPWEACLGTLECASFEVPINEDDPAMGNFVLPLIRHPATNPDKRIGSILFNPGGPGGSGVSYVKNAWVAMPSAIQESFDLVGFDPRGQAESTPAIDCVDDLGPLVALDLTPDDAAERQAILDETDKFVAGCDIRSKEILPFIGTDQIVKDMDRLREALGDEKLSYMGFSYGTFLGTIYADTYPDKVRALVLDAPLDPSLTGEQFIEGQALAFEDELEAFLDACAADPASPFYSNGDPRAAYDALLASIETKPMPVGVRNLGPGEFSYAVAAPLYRPSGWKKLAAALALATTGDASGLLALSDGYVDRNNAGTYGNSLEVYYAVTSVDTVFAKDPAVYEAMTNDLRVKAPRLGATFPYTALPSARWNVASWRTPAPANAVGAPPILVVGGTGDPATPYAWSVALASQLDSATLLTRDGLGHVSFLKGITCIDQAISDYIVDLKMPTKGTVCK